MRINQRFRTRKDLECHIVYFQNDEPLEMTEVAAYIVGLLNVERTTQELVEAVKVKFPDVDAADEVAYTVQCLTDVAVLA